MEEETDLIIWKNLDERLVSIEARLSAIEGLLGSRMPPDMVEVLADILGIRGDTAQIASTYRLMSTQMQRLSSDMVALDADVRDVLLRVAERRREEARAARKARETP